MANKFTVSNHSDLIVVMKLPEGVTKRIQIGKMGDI